MLLAALVAIAVALWVPLLRSTPPARYGAWHGHLATAIVLALGFIVLEGAQAHVEVRRQTFSITLSEAPLVVGLALTSPLVLLLARGLAMVVVGDPAPGRRRQGRRQHRAGHDRERRRPGALPRLHVGEITHPGAWPAVYLAILVADAVSAVFVALAITLTQGRPSRRDLALFLPPYHHRRPAV